jgi:malonate decarboxylase alpha subunit
MRRPPGLPPIGAGQKGRPEVDGADARTAWDTRRQDRAARLEAASRYANGKVFAAGDATALLEAIIKPFDHICVEGDNQKQADFLAAALAAADPERLHDLHVVQSGVVLPEHIDLFRRGIANKLDFSYSGHKAAPWRAPSAAG